MTFHLMEPELEDLLQEIARDPRSTLLRVDRPTILRGLFDRDPMVRESCTQLTSAERQLLRAHRSELGQALHDACARLLDKRNCEVFYYCKDHGNGSYPPQLEEEVIARRITELSRVDPSAKMHSAVARAVSSADPLTYAALGCRILPSTGRFLLLSDCYQLQGDREADQQSLGAAEMLVSGWRDRAHLLSYQAYHLLLHGQLSTALRKYQSSIQAGGRWPGEMLSWLCLSVQCADERQLREALEALDQTRIVEHTLEEWIQAQTLMRERGLWSPTDASAGFWSAHENTSNEQAHHVLHTLFAQQ